MNCHKNNHDEKNTQENEHKKHRNHMLLMVLCCALPIVVLFALPLLKINNAGLNKILPFLTLMLCPLMHVLMIPMMMRKDKNKKNTGTLNDQSVLNPVQIKNDKEDLI